MPYLPPEESFSIIVDGVPGGAPIERETKIFLSKEELDSYISSLNLLDRMIIMITRSGRWTPDEFRNEIKDGFRMMDDPIPPNSYYQIHIGDNSTGEHIAHIDTYSEEEVCGEFEKFYSAFDTAYNAETGSFIYQVIVSGSWKSENELRNFSDVTRDLYDKRTTLDRAWSRKLTRSELLQRRRARSRRDKPVHRRYAHVPGLADGALQVCGLGQTSGTVSAGDGVFPGSQQKGEGMNYDKLLKWEVEHSLMCAEPSDCGGSVLVVYAEDAEQALQEVKYQLRDWFYWGYSLVIHGIESYLLNTDDYAELALREKEARQTA